MVILDMIAKNKSKFKSILSSGGGFVRGETTAEIEPFGTNGHSIAFFKDVFFTNCNQMMFNHD